jgi:hypothetical protein
VRANLRGDFALAKRNVPGATETHIVVLIARVPIQVQCESPGVDAIVPIPAAEQDALRDFIPRPPNFIGWTAKFISQTQT